jgi:hypothetical protein
MPYASVEKLLVAWLETHLTAEARVVTELPADLASKLPVVRVTKFGGADDVLTIDRPTVDVDCYAVSRGAAEDLAEQVRDLLRFTLRGQTVGGVTVSRTRTMVGPHWLPYDDTALRRSGASYELTIRRPLN